MQFPIFIGLRRSRFIDGGLVIVVLTSLFVLAGVPWPPAYSVTLGGMVLLIGFAAARAVNPRIEVLRIERDGTISGKPTAESTFHALSLLSGAWVSPWLTVLRLVGERGEYRLVIAADSALPDQLRRLRVCLRWRREISGVAEDS